MSSHISPEQTNSRKDPLRNDNLWLLIQIINMVADAGHKKKYYDIVSELLSNSNDVFF